MAELRTEEEQIEAIKRWWKENGVSLLIGAAIAAAGVFAWKAGRTIRPARPKPLPSATSNC